ncbi:MAG TPA: 6-phosphofructokinase [Dehalococcoidia bacterium]|nr:6-phosphofructokinase [Dehalococcoidia bacterium]
MRSIGLLTSGGDSPGMNATIRAVVRTAIRHGRRAVGILNGYSGLLAGQFEEMDVRSVGNIIQRGGTILGTSRCPEFHEVAGRARGIEQLRKHGIDALVVIGGEGSFKGAVKLQEESGIPIVGAAGTIDNDIYGTDYSIGFDTAVNTALDAIDRLRDTAESHGRVFFVEVMGRHAGFIALEVGLAGGAVDILVPEYPDDMDRLANHLLERRSRGRQSSIVVVSEGDELGGVFATAQEVSKRITLDYRVAVLGHVQRGGAPTARDRVLGTRMGAAAVRALIEGQHGCMAGEVGGKLVLTPLQDTWQRVKPLDADLYSLMHELSG